jgi:hypothetical protein
VSKDESQAARLGSRERAFSSGWARTETTHGQRGRLSIEEGEEGPRAMLTSSDTGDNLHFGLARLMAHSAGNENVELVVVGDDVSVPHSRGKMVGRRCLAGITLGEYSTYLILCALKSN